MQSLSEVLIISAMILTIYGGICFNRLVRIGLSSQFLFGVDRMIFWEFRKGHWLEIAEVLCPWGAGIST